MSEVLNRDPRNLELTYGLAVLVAVGDGLGGEGGDGGADAAGLADGDATTAGVSILVACEATTCHVPLRRA